MLRCRIDIGQFFQSYAMFVIQDFASWRLTVGIVTITLHKVIFVILQTHFIDAVDIELRVLYINWRTLHMHDFFSSKRRIAMRLNKRVHIQVSLALNLACFSHNYNKLIKELTDTYTF